MSDTQDDYLKSLCHKFFKPLLEVLPEKRIERQKILVHLKTFRRKLFKVKNVEQRWKKFNILIVSSQIDKILLVNDQTQAFLDNYRFSLKLMTETPNSSQLITGGTRLHN